MMCVVSVRGVWVGCLWVVLYVYVCVMCMFVCARGSIDIHFVCMYDS